MLAACRSLHEGGYDVTAVSGTRLAASQWSRSCARRLRVTDARENAQSFVEELRQELTRRSYATLLAGSDRALCALSRGRARLCELTELGLPAASVVEQALSRECLTGAAAIAGLVPATSIRCEDLEQALFPRDRSSRARPTWLCARQPSGTACSSSASWAIRSSPSGASWRVGR